ncbi:hypothetical protein BC826DRAFT_1000882, partial [Russula brevipes]
MCLRCFGALQLEGFITRQGETRRRASPRNANGTTRSSTRLHRQCTIPGGSRTQGDCPSRVEQS